MTAAEIALTGVARRYENAHVLQDVTLTAPAGKVLALLGPSGSGKSTILRLIAGLEPIDAGEIRIDNEIASTPSRTTPPEARRIGLVFQDYALFPHLTALANVGFGLDRIARAEREAISLRWLDRVGLSKRAHAFPHELSGGEQQRVALARALAPNPRAVLLDEPFSGLDPTLRAELREVTLAALGEAGATAVFVTHHADEALLVADRLAILKDGRVLQESAARDAYDKPASAEAAAALGPVNVFDAVVKAGVAHTPFIDAPAPNFADNANVRVVIRAEAIRLTDGARARIRERRPQGPFDLVILEANGALCRALVQPRSASSETADIAVDPAGLFVFRV
jgi:iron(III) transport system ATP-binding protein